MKSFSISNFAMVLTIGMVSLATASPLGADVRISSTTRTDSCSKDTITNCVSTTGLDGTTCFARICTSLKVPELRRRSNTETDQCNEDGLLECAITENKNSDLCFEELCLGED
jgi:hypothetical protein